MEPWMARWQNMEGPCQSLATLRNAATRKGVSVRDVSEDKLDRMQNWLRLLIQLGYLKGSCEPLHTLGIDFVKWCMKSIEPVDGRRYPSRIAVVWNLDMTRGPYKRLNDGALGIKALMLGLYCLWQDFARIERWLA